MLIRNTINPLTEMVHSPYKDILLPIFSMNQHSDWRTDISFRRQIMNIM